MDGTSEVGSCYTQPSAKTGTAVEAGVDTWRLARYLDDDRDLGRAISLCQGEGRGPLLSSERPCGHVVGVVPGHRMLWIEGHPAVEGLAHPATLAKAATDVLAAVGELGFPLGRDAGVSRADGTVTLAFEEGHQGRAVLQGVASLDFPRSMPVVWGRPPETVYIASESGRGMKARVYDKALEALSGPPGTLVRFENQARYGKPLRRTVEEIDLPHVRQRFEARFGPLAKSAAGLTVASLPVIAARVHERILAGEIPRREAERLVGFMALHQAGDRGYPRRTMFRRRRELRARGLVLADDFFEPVEVDLGQTIEAALGAWE